MKNGPYELVIAPDDYPGKRYRDRYCYKHHLVWWQNTGTLVPEGHLLHHKNGDHRDNRFENLHLLHIGDHNKYHATGRTYVWLKCAWCGVYFEREKRCYTFKYNDGQRNFYCGRSHQVKDQHYNIKKKKMLLHSSIGM